VTQLDFDKLTLRREGFGGIVFNPLNGTHLELDLEAFELAVDYFVRGMLVDSDRYEFLLHLKNSLGEVPRSQPRFVDNPHLNGGVFRLLSAPTLADIQITSVCTQGCPHCYASANARGEHMPFADIERILNSCADVGVLQVAFGGGDPLLHPQIVDILKATRDHCMVPNITTSGAYFSNENLRALKHYCGAVALSLEGVEQSYNARRSLGWSGFLNALEYMAVFDIPTVLQVTLGASNLRELPSIVEFALTHKLYGVIFLAYKPVGRGRGFDQSLAALPSNDVAKALSQAFRLLHPHTRIGYDCCLSAIVTGMNEDVFGHGNEDIEGCSALRGSIGISVRQELLPCTFLEKSICADLRKTSILEGWRGLEAGQFRETQQKKAATNPICGECKYFLKCLGGCPALNLGTCSTMAVSTVSPSNKVYK
jgi:radical SAM protein with 4Fe4S-binding SPASM domain